MFSWIRRLLASESGQISIDAIDGEPVGGAEDTSEGTAQSDDPFTSEWHSAQQGEEGEQSEEGDETQAQAQAPEEGFLDGSELDPTKLPPEIQPIWKKMQGTYTKKMQGISEVKSKAEMVDRFYNDPDFANQTLVAYAAQNGYQLTPINGAGQQQTQQQAPQQASDVPPQIVEAFKQNLGPELQWLSEPQAKAMYQATQIALKQMLQPVFDAQAKQLAQQQSAEYDKYAQELSEKVPGWETHEDTMADMLKFLKSDGQMFHPKFGSKHQLLYNLATQQAQATSEAVNRINGVVKNRPSSGRTSMRPVVDVNKEIGGAKTSDDAWELAAKYARQSLNQ